MDDDEPKEVVVERELGHERCDEIVKFRCYSALQHTRNFVRVSYPRLSGFVENVNFLVLCSSST